MAFPTYSMISVILGSIILVLTWIASNKMKKCTSTGVHTNLQILMMVGTANVVLGFTGLLDHTMVKASQIINMVYIFAVGTITMVSSIFLLKNANASSSDDSTDDKLEGCESVDTEGMILAIIGGIIVLGFVSKVVEYWKAEQEVSSSELKQKQAMAKAATKAADLAQKAVDQKLDQQKHELEMQSRKNSAIMKREEIALEKLEAKSNAISVEAIGQAEARRRTAIINTQEQEATNLLKEAQQKQKYLENQATEITNKQKLAQQLHTKSITEAKLGVQQSQAALAEQEQRNRLFKQVMMRHSEWEGKSAFRMKKTSSRKAKKGKKKAKKGKKGKNC